MSLNFKIVSEATFATIEKDPHTFYQVIHGSYTLTIGLYDNYYNLLKTWEELEEMGLDLSKDYSDNPQDNNYYDNPNSGSAKNVLGKVTPDPVVLVTPDNIGKIGDNALRDSNASGLTSPSSSNQATPGVVNVPSGSSVGNNAFSGTNVGEANIPADAGTVSGNAFADTPAAQTNNINMGGHPVQNIDVDPENPTGIILEKGYYYKVMAFYNAIDDVTHESTIASLDESVVRFIPDCYLKAVEVGTAIITGTYTLPNGSKRYAEIECTIVDNGGGITTHVGGEPVIENETEYTYEEVVYCIDCGEELSRVTQYKPFDPPSFDQCTDEEVEMALEMHYAGAIDIYDYWDVGDEREITVDSMNTIVGSGTHQAQTVTMVIMNKGGKTLSTPVNGTTECAFIVGQKNLLLEDGQIGTSKSNYGGWKNSSIRTWCNDTYYNALPSDFKSLLKQFKNNTGKGGGSSSGVDETDDYIAFPAEIEVTNTANNSVEGEGSQFEYYTDTKNRIKKLGDNGSNYYWNLRSPSKNDSKQYCYINANGNLSAGYPTSRYGFAPFGVI